MEFHKGRAFAKFLLSLSFLAFLFAVIAATAQLWFLPPSEVNAAWTPPHLLAYDYLWNAARALARWGLSQGFFPEEIHQFKSQGVPAFLPWLVVSAGMLALAALVGLISLFFPAVGRAPSHDAEPTLAAVSGASQANTADEARKAPGQQQVSSHPPSPTPDSSLSAKPLESPGPAEPVAPLAADQVHQAFGKLVEESLLYSEAQLSHAQESVERLRRALVNVYLDAGSTATEDMQDLRSSIEELEITLETLKGEQHRVMAALVSQAPLSNVAAASH
jgi:hypothetical protein